MEWGTYAGLITAVCTAITAVGGMIVALRVLIPNYRTVKDTHKIVNQQRTDMLNFQTTLINKLKEAGVEVPKDQSRANDG